MAARAARQEQTGKKPGGKLPQAPQPGPKASDQINLTDEESRIMPVAGGGFEQAYNAQAAVDASTLLVIGTGVTQAPNDKQQIVPMLQTLAAQRQTKDEVTHLIADTGFFSEKNLQACEAAKIAPLIAVARDEHHPGWRERHSEPLPLPQERDSGANHVAPLANKGAGARSTLCASKRLNQCSGSSSRCWAFGSSPCVAWTRYAAEWSLVCLAWNLKRLAVLRQKSVPCV